MEVDDANVVNIRLVGQILTNDSLEDNIKLQAIQNLKKNFSNSNNNFNNISLASLLDNTTYLQTPKKSSHDFMLNYGLALINFLGRDTFLDMKIFKQIELVLFKLKKQNDNLSNVLIKKLWHQFEVTSTYNSEFIKKILNVSKMYLEEVVINWVDGMIITSEKDYHVQMSIDSPELFQAITAIFYLLLEKSQGHSRILELLNWFVRSVKSLCDRRCKDFFILYPKDLRCLVCLLMVPPDIYSEKTKPEKLVTRSLVNGLLSDMFFTDRRRTLILLSNYPDWLYTMKIYLKENFV